MLRLICELCKCWLELWPQRKKKGKMDYNLIELMKLETIFLVGNFGWRLSQSVAWACEKQSVICWWRKEEKQAKYPRKVHDRVDSQILVHVASLLPIDHYLSCKLHASHAPSPPSSSLVTHLSSAAHRSIILNSLPEMPSHLLALLAVIIVNVWSTFRYTIETLPIFPPLVSTKWKVGD